ncbi:hypothetical protein BDV95DRAFT_599521 [Massariosphaeria phaeospora]|uniref:Uncharacterized protein n=1 Tax=Massariosphaeria phaeospora TaxID=100035 RepID=A0A7C8I396_9PLEO|nr:hypothetical protein BDV95DRAFT_599521 [Massariosphaeria phaeospora]
MLSAILLQVFLFGTFSVVTSSDITTYSDTKCGKSFFNFDGPNGYPDGVCTKLQLAANQSAQIVGLEPGCAVTLYGPDETFQPCSSSIKIVGQIATCYNSSWAYFSIDGCRNPNLPITPSSLTTSTPTPTSTSTSTSTPLDNNSNHTGVIVGGFVGGVAAIAFAFTAAFLILRRRMRRCIKPLPSLPTYELSGERGLLEITYPGKVARTEQKAAFEMGRNSVYVPPVELQGDTLVGHDKKGMNSLTRIHLVP